MSFSIFWSMVFDIVGMMSLNSKRNRYFLNPCVSWISGGPLSRSRCAQGLSKLAPSSFLVTLGHRVRDKGLGFRVKGFGFRCRAEGLVLGFKPKPETLQLPCLGLGLRRARDRIACMPWGIGKKLESPMLEFRD